MNREEYNKKITNGYNREFLTDETYKGYVLVTFGDKDAPKESKFSKFGSISGSIFKNNILLDVIGNGIYVTGKVKADVIKQLKNIVNNIKDISIHNSDLVVGNSITIPNSIKYDPYHHIGDTGIITIVEKDIIQIKFKGNSVGIYKQNIF